MAHSLNLFGQRAMNRLTVLNIGTVNIILYRKILPNGLNAVVTIHRFLTHGLCLKPMDMMEFAMDTILKYWGARK